MGVSESTAKPQILLARLRTLLPWGVAILIVLQLARWGGLPRSGLLAFWAGVVVLITVAVVLALVGRKWLANSAERSADPRPELSRLLASLLLLAGAAIGIGGFWDEVWHRSYGVPFGNDLLWRPHLLMYLGLAGVIATALVVLLLALRRPGRLRDRLRVEPAHTLLLLLGGFLLYSLPADPLWHIVYGADISAWSVPHLLLAFNFAAITLVAVALMKGASGPIASGRRALLRGQDLFAVAAFALALNLLLQILATEWDHLRFIPISPQGAFWDRPEWLFPALLAGLAALIGIVANRTTSRIGAASLTGIVALGFRFALLLVFGYDGASADPWLLVLPPLVSLDLAALALARTRPLSSWRSALAIAAGTALGTLPLLPSLMIYPRIEIASMAPQVLAIIVVAFGIAPFATRLGTWLATTFAGAPSQTSTRPWLLPGLAGVLLVAVAWFISTATPPV